MIKRFNLLLIAISLFASSLYSFGGTVPAGLPNYYGFGVADKQDPYAPDMPNRWKDGQGTTCWDYSYQYLVPGWATWSPGGAWARDELLYWEARGQIQVFTYYYSYGNRAYFQNSTNMQNYWKDLKLLFQVINANSSKKVIVHFEPDGIGFWRQANQSVSATGSVLVGSVSASSGVTELNGIPDSLQGWSRGIKILRDTYAPNKALLAHHYTHWATGSDVFVTDVNSSTQAGCDSHVDNMTSYMLSIENGAANAFDLFFVDPSDRDAAWYDAFGSGGRWTADTWGGFAGTRTWGRIGYIVNRVSTSLGRRGMMWQIPEGNEYYTTCNNTDGHYKDDHAQEAFLRPGAGGPGDGYVAGSTTNGPGFWASNGIIATLFGSGYYGQKPPDGNNVTHVRNYKNDGITGNGPSSDDDGGYIRLGVAAYCAKGKYPLGPVPTATRTFTTGPTLTRTNTFTITPTFTQTPFICSKFIYDGDTTGIRLADGAATASSPGTFTETTGGSPGNAMRLNYAVPFATPYWQAHKWVPPAAVRTIADNTTLRFEVKTAAGTAPNFLIVIDWSLTTYQVQVNTYVTGGIDSTWKTAVIPLSVLKAAGLTNINEINFINNNDTAYIVMVDNIRLTGGACPSATPTVSATYTRTSTRTITLTGTTTSTPPPTSTYTRTRTYTPSFTVTPTSSGTPSSTATVAVPTSTYTSTRTATNTPLPPTGTYTVTSTRTGTYTRTVTNTQVPPTETFTWTPSRTPTVAVPTNTFTPSRTATLISSPSFTPTNTVSRTGTPTFTATRTSTTPPTITNTWTPGFGTYTFTPTVTVTGSRTVTPVNTSTFTRTATGTATLPSTATYTRTPGPSATSTDTVPTVTYTPSRTSTATRVPSVTITSSYTRTASATRTFTELPSATYTQTIYQSPTVTNTVDMGTQPDLIIVDMSITMLTIPPCPTGSELLGTLVSFRNSGNDDAGPFDVELNGQVINVAGLAMGAGGSVWFAGQAIPGNTTAVIDFNLAVSESNETNNSFAQLLPLPSAVATCTPVVTETFTATDVPTELPTAVSTETPTQVPTDLPTELPTGLATQLPTDTATEAPTNTQVTAATYTVTSTVTRTSTLVSTPTLTRTPTVTSTRTPLPTVTVTQINTPVILELTGNSCTSYPNPAFAGAGLRIRFNINRSASKVVFTMFTTSFRKVRQFERQPLAVINNLTRGDNEMQISPAELDGLSAGVYFYYIKVENNSQSVKSKTEKIIIIK